ncbi:MAG TPA: hypothetical protein ENI51_04135, partial [Candidatus Atribacteria bacterium]|nr:hypothetical protein [Candidatus Atribacteria bacterium]
MTISIRNPIVEILKEQNKSIENAKTNQEFFVSLADYVKFIKTTSELEKIIQKITEAKDKLLTEWNKYETATLTELDRAKEKLLKIVKQNKISSPELDKAIEELNSYETGKIFSSGIKSDNIENYLWEIAKAIFQTRHKKFLKEFIEEKPVNPNIYINNKNFVFSKTIEKRRKKDKEIENLWVNGLQGCWERLYFVSEILLGEGKNPLEFFSKEDTKRVPYFRNAIGEYMEIFDALNKFREEPLYPLTTLDENRLSELRNRYRL